MSCEQFQTELKDKAGKLHEYSYTQLSAKKSLKLKYRLIGIFGGALPELFAKIDASEEEQLEAFCLLLQDIFVKHDPDEIVALEEYILAPAFRDGERIDFDTMYTSNTFEMYRAVAWVLSKEYGDFFGVIGSLAPKLKQAVSG